MRHIHSPDIFPLHQYRRRHLHKYTNIHTDSVYTYSDLLPFVKTAAHNMHILTLTLRMIYFPWFPLLQYIRSRECEVGTG